MRRRIVDAASRKLRAEGLKGATIANVLGDAGLTHGTFYAHFESKEALLAEAFVTAAAQTSERWIKGVSDLPMKRGVGLLLTRNLGTAHLRNLETGCPFVAAGAEVWRGNSELRAAYQQSMLAVARKVASSLGNQGDMDLALAIHAICIGGLTMARSALDEKVALRIMRACRKLVLERLPPRKTDGSRRNRANGNSR
jgi:TetR/AcrR family transcriptional repressor of nem operon